MTAEIVTTDKELEELMAELEAQNAEFAAASKKEPVPEPTPEPTPAPAPIETDIVVPLPEPKDPTVPRNAEALANPVVLTDEVAAQVLAEVVAEVAVEPSSLTVKIDATEVAQEVGKVIAKAVEELQIPPQVDVPKAPTLKYFIDAGQFRADTRVSEENLDQCMIEQNGLRAYYGTQAALAEAQAARQDAKFDVVEATLYDHHRKQFAARGEKATEKMVENAVKMDSRWLRAKNAVIESDTIAAINKHAVESLKDRASMIMQLGADRRDEYRGATRIMQEKNEREDLRDRAKDAAGRAITA